MPRLLCQQDVLISMYSSIPYMPVPGFIRIVRGSIRTHVFKLNKVLPETGSCATY